MSISTYWGHHYSGVAATTVEKADDIVEEDMVVEEMFDVEAIERVSYGEICSLDGNSSI